MTDEERWLTEPGRGTALAVGAKLAELGLRPVALYSSPLVRALQTTELIARSFPTARVEVHAPLAIDEGSVPQVAAVLDRHAPSDTVVLVTHEPKIRSIAAHFARKPSFRGFATAESALFRGEKGKLSLVWCLDPERLVTTSEAVDND